MINPIARKAARLMKFYLMLASLALVVAACGVSAAVESESVPAGVEPAAASPVLAAPRDLTLRLGAGQDTVSVNAFLPSEVAIRVDDTVTWQMNHTDEPHTVTFLSGGGRPPGSIPIPGEGATDFQSGPKQDNPTRAAGEAVEIYSGTGFVNSGFMANFNDTATYSLTFDTPGTYEYVCLLHPPMTASITVLPAESAGVPSQEEIDAQGRLESEELIAMAESLQAGQTKVVKELGPNGSTIWHVEAGGTGFDQRSEIYEFLSDDITISEGDTVVWSSISPSIHTVTFHPGIPQPEFVIFEPQADAPPILRINPDVLFPVKPAGEFDGTGYWNSGLMDSVGSPGGHAFTMAFTKAGSFDYVCAIHSAMGMKGTVTVVPAPQ